MKIIVQPSKFNGKIKANPSKSIMQRVIALGALSNSSLIIENRDNSMDSNAALNIANAMAGIGGTLAAGQVAAGQAQQQGASNILGLAGSVYKAAGGVGGIIEMDLVRAGGLEPPRPYGQQILSLACLPIPPRPQQIVRGK